LNNWCSNEKSLKGITFQGLILVSALGLEPRTY
jgi:hypothetical protein